MAQRTAVSDVSSALLSLRDGKTLQPGIVESLQVCLIALEKGSVTTDYLLNEGLAELLHHLVSRYESTSSVHSTVAQLLEALRSHEPHRDGTISPVLDRSSLLKSQRVEISSAPAFESPPLQFMPYRMNKANRWAIQKQGLGLSKKRARPIKQVGPIVAGMKDSGTAYASPSTLHNRSSSSRLPKINSNEHPANFSGPLKQQPTKNSEVSASLAGIQRPSIAPVDSLKLERQNADPSSGLNDRISVTSPQAAGFAPRSVSYVDDYHVSGDSTFYNTDEEGGDDRTTPLRLWRGGVEIAANLRLILDIYRNESVKQPTLLSAHSPMISMDVCNLQTGQSHLIALSETQLGQASLLPDILRMHEASPIVQASYIERLVDYLGIKTGVASQNDNSKGVESMRLEAALPIAVKDAEWEESTIQADSVTGMDSSHGSGSDYNDRLIVTEWASLEDKILALWKRRIAEQRAREERAAVRAGPKPDPDYSTPDERLRAAIQKQRLETQKNIERSRPKSPSAKVFVAANTRRTDIVVDLSNSLMNIEPVKVAPDIVDPMLSLFRCLDPLNFGFVTTEQFKLVLTLSGSRLTLKEERALIEQYGIQHPEGLTAASGREKVKAEGSVDADLRSEEINARGEEAEAPHSSSPLRKGIQPEIESRVPKETRTSKEKRSPKKNSSPQKNEWRKEKLRKRREEDALHGVSPQAIAATVAAARLQSRVEREKLWPLDYERFCLAGRLVRLVGMDKNIPPVAAWAEKLKKNKIERPNEELLWNSHVRNFQQRRMIAVTWLMKRGLRAQRHYVNKALVFHYLKLTAMRAGAFAFIQEKVRVALRHEEKKRNARAFLLERQARVKRHRNLHAETFRLLKKLIQKQIANARATNFEASNQNRCWLRLYHSRQAFKWLVAKAAVQKRRYMEKTQTYQWLRALGKMATIARSKMDREQILIETLGRKAVLQSARRFTSFERNLNTVAKAREQWYDQYEAADWLHGRANFTLTHLENQAGAFAYLKRLGEGVLRFVFRGQLAKQWLVEAGNNAIKHNQAQYEAREYLQRIQDGAAGVVDKRDKTFEWLKNIVERSQKHLRKCERAKVELKQSVLLAKRHTTFMGRAKMELHQMVDEARVNAEMEALAKANSRRIQALISQIKEEDKTKNAERKNLSAEEALRLEMEEAFNIFDLDGSGEIDRLEFAHLLRGGALFKLARDEIDDVYTQIDKDRSGAVDFEEFWAWCQYEFRKTPGRKIKISMILSAKERAMRRLLLEERSRKSLENDRGPAQPKKAAGDNKSPSKELLRQEKKRFLDLDDDDDGDRNRNGDGHSTTTHATESS